MSHAGDASSPLFGGQHAERFSSFAARLNSPASPPTALRTALPASLSRSPAFTTPPPSDASKPAPAAKVIPLASPTPQTTLQRREMERLRSAVMDLTEANERLTVEKRKLEAERERAEESERGTKLECAQMRRRWEDAAREREELWNEYESSNETWAMESARLRQEHESEREQWRAEREAFVRREVQLRAEVADLKAKLTQAAIAAPAISRTSARQPAITHYSSAAPVETFQGSTATTLRRLERTKRLLDWE